MPDPKVIENLRTEFFKLNLEFVELRTELKSFKETVKIIHGDGNTQSLITQLALNVAEVKLLKEQLKKNNHEKIILWTALITGLFGLIGSIVTGLMNYHK